MVGLLKQAQQILDNMAATYQRAAVLYEQTEQANAEAFRGQPG